MNECTRKRYKHLTFGHLKEIVSQYSSTYLSDSARFGLQTLR